jgi:hypothetical protein
LVVPWGRFDSKRRRCYHRRSSQALPFFRSDPEKLASFMHTAAVAVAAAANKKSKKQKPDLYVW